jgi:hypothetical protein
MKLALLGSKITGTRREHLGNGMRFLSTWGFLVRIVSKGQG